LKATADDFRSRRAHEGKGGVLLPRQRDVRRPLGSEGKLPINVRPSRYTGTFSKWWLLIGALLLVAVAGWFALFTLRQGARPEQTSGSGQKAAGLPASGAAEPEIPTDSFRVTFSDAATTDKVVRKTVRVEMPPGLAKAKAYRFGVGESAPEMKGVEGLLQTNGVFFIEAEWVGTNEAGVGMIKLTVGHAGQSVWVEGGVPSRFLPEGKTLTDVITMSARPGLYKMGAAVALGRVTQKGAQLPLTLHVFDADEKEARIRKQFRDWSRAPSLLTDHAYHGAVDVDGKIYVVGGGADVEMLDPKRNAWESLGKSPTDCDFPAVAALGKQIYVIGGVGAKKNLATVDVFEVASKKWQAGVPLHIARSRLAAVAYGGKLYAIGGYIGDAKNTGVVEEYDPAKRAWVKKAGMPTPLHGHAAVVVNNRIFVIGGYRFDSGKMGAWSGVEEYDPESDRWRSRSAMPGGGRGFLGAAVVGGKVFAIGGHRDQFRVERYDPETDRWSALGRPPGPFERGGTATIGNEIYLIGGEMNPRGVWRFRPQTD
jgi:N-acetylneuraminic acid mutarotase